MQLMVSEQTAAESFFPEDVPSTRTLQGFTGIVTNSHMSPGGLLRTGACKLHGIIVIVSLPANPLVPLGV